MCPFPVLDGGIAVTVVASSRLAAVWTVKYANVAVCSSTGVRLTPKAGQLGHLYERSVCLGTNTGISDLFYRLHRWQPSLFLSHSDKIRTLVITVSAVRISLTMTIYIYTYKLNCVWQECVAVVSRARVCVCVCVFIISAQHMAHVCRWWRFSCSL